MKRLLLILSFVFLFSSFTSIMHKYYLSVSEIEYKAESKSLQITTRVFIDDFQDVLNKRYGQSADFTKENGIAENKNLIEKYLTGKLIIKTDNQLVELEYLGGEIEGDQLVLYIEGTEVENFRKILVTNLILTDLYSDQKNVVHVQIGDQIKSFLLVKEKPSESLIF